MADNRGPITNIEEAEEHEHLEGKHWGGYYRVLTPRSDEDGGRLGANLTRLPSGRVCVPFHYHMKEDELFYVISGTGVLRYGDELYDVRPGDFIECPAGTEKGHQLANTGDEDLLYLAIGPNDPNEVAVYPDSGKVMVRSLGAVGFVEEVDYMEGESDVPKVFELLDDDE